MKYQIINTKDNKVIKTFDAKDEWAATLVMYQYGHEEKFPRMYLKLKLVK